jgi:hypothetical protein
MWGGQRVPGKAPDTPPWKLDGSEYYGREHEGDDGDN